jgi:hypothetical protein
VIFGIKGKFCEVCAGGLPFCPENSRVESRFLALVLTRFNQLNWVPLVLGPCIATRRPDQKAKRADMRLFDL